MSFCSMVSKGKFDVFHNFQFILALHGLILMKLVTKLKIFDALTDPEKEFNNMTYKKLERLSEQVQKSWIYCRFGNFC